MALANYTDLQTSIQGHLRRSDLTSLIPDFIAMGEARLNRTLRLLQQETIESLTASTSTRFVALPSNFLEAINLTMIVSNYPQALYPVAADKMDEVRFDQQAVPQYYRISDQIEFDCFADQAYSLKLRMFKRWNLASDTTNWLMTNSPDCYIYAALIAASPYIKDDSRMELWRSLLSAAIEEANDLDSRTRSDTIMTLDAGILSRGRYDIQRDA